MVWEKNLWQESVWEETMAETVAELSTEDKSTGDWSQETSEETQSGRQPSASLAVHFLNVGAADCILLEQNGRYLMIDTGDGEDMARIAGYLDTLGVERLDGLLLTHMHADHIGSAAGLLETYGAEQIWMQDHGMDTAAYQKLQKVLKKNQIPVTEPGVGDHFTWQDCQFTVLGPLRQYEDYNDQSLVVCMEYGDHRYLFTGDMEKEAEQDLLILCGATGLAEKFDLAAEQVNYSDLLTGVTVLKAGHHGRDSSSSQMFLQVIQPEITVIPCGTGADGEDSGTGGDGPGEQALARLTAYSEQLYRTDEGTVVLVDDGQTIEGSIIQTEVLPTRTWIGNVKTGVYHRSDCENLPAVQNRCYFTGAQDAESKGYRPCGGCVQARSDGTK